MINLLGIDSEQFETAMSNCENGYTEVSQEVILPIATTSALAISKWWQYGLPTAGIGVVGIGAYILGQWAWNFVAGAMQPIVEQIPIAEKFLSEKEFGEKLREYVRKVPLYTAEVVHVARLDNATDIGEQSLLQNITNKSEVNIDISKVKTIGIGTVAVAGAAITKIVVGSKAAAAVSEGISVSVDIVSGSAGKATAIKDKTGGVIVLEDLCFTHFLTDKLLAQAPPELDIITKRDDTIKSALDNMSIKIFRGLTSDQTSDEIPLYIKNIQSCILKEIRNIAGTYDNVLQLLTSVSLDNDKYVRSYFSYALGVNEEAVINEVIKYITKLVKDGKDFINESIKKKYQNIRIASTDQFQIADSISGQEKYVSLVKKSILNKPLLAVSSNYINEITMIADQSFTIKNGQVLTHEYNLRETLLHEISHLTTQTKDISYISVTTTGQLINVKDALNEFLDSIEKSFDLDLKLVSLEELKSLFERYYNACNIPLPNFTKDTFLQLINSNQMFKANVLCMNADHVTLMIRDLAARYIGTILNAE